MFTKINIGANISRSRKQKGLTQEALAQRVGVSAQAVSNWERGAYPDITLLPVIAAHLGMTIDALMGNGPEQQAGELAAIHEKANELYADPDSLIKYLKPYYFKYPNELWIADSLGDAIVREKTHSAENYPLVKEIAGRLMGSNYPWDRERAVWFSCMTCPDDEFEQWQNHCPGFYSETASEVMEERLLYRGQNEEMFLRHGINNFYTVCHLVMREDVSNPHARFAFDPEKAAGLGKYSVRIIETFGAVNGKVAPAWYGALGQFCLETAWYLCAVGQTEECYAAMDAAFAWYEKWLAIPRGVLLEIGDPYAFGGIKLKKGDFWNLTLPNEHSEWHPYGLLFMQDKGDLYTALTEEKGVGWYVGCEGFDAVRREERFKAYLDWAENIKDRK